MTAKRVLMVLTFHDMLGVSGKKTGNWFDEVATPYYKFKDAGFDVTIASPKGGPGPIDPFSYDDVFMTENTRKFLGDAAAQRALATTLKFNDIDVSEYAGVFFPGGYGQLWDLANDSKVIHSIEKWIAEKTPVAMVCHAPAILRDAKKPNGEPLVKGMNLTVINRGPEAPLWPCRFSLIPDLPRRTG
jgi:putative intracellular protease/amidase